MRKQFAGSREHGVHSQTERGARWGAKKDQGTKGRRVKGRGWLVAGLIGRGYDTLARRLFAATRAIRPDRPSLKAWAKPILKIRLVQPNFQGFATRLTPAPSWAFVGGLSSYLRVPGRGLQTSTGGGAGGNSRGRLWSPGTSELVTRHTPHVTSSLALPCLRGGQGVISPRDYFGQTSGSRRGSSRTAGRASSLAGSVGCFAQATRRVFGIGLGEVGHQRRRGHGALRCLDRASGAERSPAGGGERHCRYPAWGFFFRLKRVRLFAASMSCNTVSGTVVSTTA